jgi:hypothetical protein
VRRILCAGLLMLAVGCGGGGGSFNCNWTCDEDHGSKTYPAGSDAEGLCNTDFNTGCSHFACNCSN